MSLYLKKHLEAVSKGGEFDYLFFWGHRQKTGVDKSCLSQWFPAKFSREDTTYFSAEHFMMAEKARTFGDDAALSEILETLDPGKAKSIGRKVKNFDQERWDAVCFDIVVEGNFEKFSQNGAIRKFLLGTGSKVLVEASPFDQIWGIGLSQDDPRANDPHQWCGQNLLGFALMDVRSKLRN